MFNIEYRKKKIVLFIKTLFVFREVAAVSCSPSPVSDSLMLNSNA